MISICRALATSLVLCFFFIGGSSALAWEFSVKGELEYRLIYFGRTGERDLFGLASAQYALAAPDDFIGFAGPNIWGTGNSVSVAASNPLPTFLGGAGVGITRGGFSRYGSDALINDIRLTLYPRIQVNRAIRISAVINFGGLRNKFAQRDMVLGDLHDPVGTPPFERFYPITMSTSALNTAFMPSVEQIKARIMLPWGIITYGVKDLPGGPGATFGTRMRGELLTFIAPYGPMRFIVGLWPGLGFDMSESGYDHSPDRDQKNDVFVVGALTYESGPLRIVGAAFLRRYHGRQVYKINGLPFFPGVLVGDTQDFIPVLALQYCNGRFFANVDYASRTSDTHYIGFFPKFTEGYHFFSEFGALYGPVKLSLVYAIASGLVLNDRNTTKDYLPWPINYEAMEPYEFLMFNTYGGGNNMYSGFFVQDGHGMMGDAYAFAARLDYSVAANLNIWGSYIWAHRLERAGSLAGLFNETGSATFAGTPFMIANGAGVGRYVPDGFIGWEANVGVDWKLLEGLIWSTRYAYWQPGEWFDFAYQAIAPRGGVVVNDAIMKGRDAIHALKGSIIIDF